MIDHTLNIIDANKLSELVAIHAHDNAEHTGRLVELLKKRIELGMEPIVFITCDVSQCVDVKINISRRIYGSVPPCMVLEWDKDHYKCVH